MSASIAIQVLPKVETDGEVVRIVDDVIAYIQSTGLTYQVGAFETTIEGENYDELMDRMDWYMQEFEVSGIDNLQLAE